MKRITALFFAATSMASTPFGREPVERRFERVPSKGTVASVASETRAAIGSVAYGGDVCVRDGVGMKQKPSKPP